MQGAESSGKQQVTALTWSGKSRLAAAAASSQTDAGVAVVSTLTAAFPAVAAGCISFKQLSTACEQSGTHPQIDADH